MVNNSYKRFNVGLNNENDIKLHFEKGMALGKTSLFPPCNFESLIYQMIKSKIRANKRE